MRAVGTEGIRALSMRTLMLRRGTLQHGVPKGTASLPSGLVLEDPVGPGISHKPASQWCPVVSRGRGVPCRLCLFELVGSARRGTP